VIVPCADPGTATAQGAVGGCKLGKVKKRKDATAKSGKVAKQSSKAGKVLAAGIEGQGDAERLRVRLEWLRGCAR
jgi:hypothetical protein